MSLPTPGLGGHTPWEGTCERSRQHELPRYPRKADALLEPGWPGQWGTQGSRYHGVCADAIIEQSTGTVEHASDGRYTRLQNAGFPYKTMKHSEVDCSDGCIFP